MSEIDLGGWMTEADDFEVSDEEMFEVVMTQERTLRAAIAAGTKTQADLERLLAIPERQALIARVQARANREPAPTT